MDDIYRARNGKSTTYSPLAELLRKHKLSYIDGIEAFMELSAGQDVAQLFAPGGHYSVRANKILAEFAGNKISDLKVESPAGQFHPGQAL